jgi:hypothetical protein
MGHKRGHPLSNSISILNYFAHNAVISRRATSLGTVIEKALFPVGWMNLSALFIPFLLMQP